MTASTISSAFTQMETLTVNFNGVGKQDLSRVFTAEGKRLGAINIEAVRLVDINGDVRADCLWVDETGRVTTWINQLGSDKSMVPYWRAAGVTHPGMGEDVGGRESIVFGRIYSGFHTDYLRWDSAGGLLSAITAWQSLGSGGRYQKGDGALWGDMTGTGNYNYVWIKLEGNNGAAWDDKGIVVRTGMDREALHIGDWNGDGKADVIGFEKKTGAMTVWLTSYNNGTGERGGMTWARTLLISPAAGDGRADYLWVDKFIGDTSAWINGGERPESERPNLGGSKFFWDKKGPVYSGSSRGPDMHFPNLGGVGRADMVHADPTTAHVR
ncbi:hypothetical protein DL771_010387 [Monosporascus sp. 5C6A]|nr:hypothetical protein DL771_010387 [Monosporascus sp. 5C6A]